MSHFQPDYPFLFFPAYVIEGAHDHVTDRYVITVIAANPPERSVLFKPGTAARSVTLVPEPPGFVHRPRFEPGSDGTFERTVALVDDRPPCSDEDLTGGFLYGAGVVRGCYAYACQIRLDNTSLLPFTVNEEQERQSRASGDTAFLDKLNRQRLSCGRWYPIELEHDGVYAYGVFQLETINGHGQGPGKIRFLVDAMWPEGAYSAKLRRFNRMIGEVTWKA